ncbi:MAG: CoB--CoM heterodisulfide reductase iron-sulfur subunit A family protein [Acidobacteria bacterium]|jgi:quinone-modifying oxidoreductase subunit QmoA|nr:CoB--CoM heterodisulfide reductase iron-sulfur subunit A family protein [Acidobacteriota bacterium]
MAESGGVEKRGKPVLVMGGGIAGMTAAIESAEAGCDVVLVEKGPYLGGRVARMNQYFPKLCPPTCGLEINFQRLKKNPGIEVLTLAEVEKLSGSPGAYEATVKIAPRFVTDACTLCGACEQACPAERTNDFDYGLSKTKAIYLPFKMAYPAKYVIERTACPEGCKACQDACTYNAIELSEKARTITVEASAVVAATGWRPYDAAKIDNLGFGRCANVITNVMMERFAAPDGPTKGSIVRPSDSKAPASAAFVQCAGSRDENHLPYCSAVCCSASLKQATYLRAQYPEMPITIYYIDIRTPGRLEDFYQKVAEEQKIRLVKGKVAKVEEDAATKDLLVTFEDVLAGKKVAEKVGLLVLATGIVPNTEGLPEGFKKDDFGFLARKGAKGGFIAAGCVSRPEEVSATVQDGTGAALKALQSVVRSAHHG